MDDKKYFSHAWALLTRDKGWIKPVLVMTAANLVPIAGFLGNQGYAMEWARLTAWGVDAAPKQKNVDVGKCISSGWRAFVVLLGWQLVYGAVFGILTNIGTGDARGVRLLIQGIIGLLGIVVGSLWGTAVLVTQIRAAIYEKIGAGYRPSAILEMIRRDTSGFIKVFLINLGCVGAQALFGMLLGVGIALAAMPAFTLVMGGADEYAVVSALASSLGGMAVIGAVFGSLLGVASTICKLVTTQVAALWIRQFNVARWGRSEDPLPE